MRNLLIYRHAKSLWDNPFLSDHARPLAERGLRDAPQMAQRLKRKKIFPDLILSSDAERAKATALITAENLHFPRERIEFTPKLYHASASTILSLIQQTQDDINTLFVFGHNPGLNDLVELLGGIIDNLPTCGQFGFNFETGHWTNISQHNAKGWFFDYPKNM